MSGFRQTVVLLSVIGLLFIGCKDIATAAPHARTQSVSLLPEIRGFLAKHQNWGTPGRVQAEPNWARGRRQRVTLSGRSLLFYTEGGKVVTVYEDMPSGRKKIWGSYSSPAVQRPKRSRASASLPAYTIPFSVSKFGGGGVIGDAIIPSMTPRTPVAERARVAKAIAAKEGISELSLYSNESARKANMSESYRVAHPTALKKGYLGSVNNGKFTP